MEKQDQTQGLLIEDHSFSPLNQKRQQRKIESEHYPEYAQYLGLSDVDEQSINLRRSNLINLMNCDYIITRIEKMYKMKLQVIDQNKHHDIISLLVMYGYYKAILTILIKEEESPVHQVTERMEGNFATAYRINLFNEEAAVKCHHFDKKGRDGIEKNFQFEFIGILREYVLLAAASKLQAAPYLSKPWGFDLIVYKNCIEFAMEYCEMDTKYSRDVEAELKESLTRLHLFNTIHFDVKSDNVCYSPKFRKAVFIDFGLSEVVREPPGYKTHLQFRGSLPYCSEEMRMCFTEGSRVVDAYFNDIVCLQKLVQEKKMLKFNEISIKKELMPINLTYHFVLSLIRYYLFDNCNDNIQKKSIFFEKYKAFIIKKYYQEVKEALQERPFTYFAGKVIEQYRSLTFQKEMIAKKQLYPAIHEAMTFKQQQDLTDSFASFKSSEIRQICESVERLSTSEINNLLSSLDEVRQMALEQYLLLLADCLKIESNKFTYSQKLVFSQAFFKVFQIELCHRDDYIQKCIECIFDFVIKSQSIRLQIQILQEIITSIIVFETKSEEQLVFSLQRILKTNNSITQKEKIIILFIEGWYWIRYKVISKYNFIATELLLWNICKTFYKKYQHQEEQREKIQFLFSFLKVSKLRKQKKQDRQSFKSPNRLSHKDLSKISQSQFESKLIYFSSHVMKEDLFYSSLFYFACYTESEHQYELFEQIVKLTIRFMHFKRNIFPFLLFELYPQFSTINFQKSEIQYIYGNYCERFSSYNFFKHFSIYTLQKMITLKIVSFSNFDIAQYKKQIQEISMQQKMYKLEHRLKYYPCFLYIIEKLFGENSQIQQKFQVERGFWYEQTMRTFRDNHKYDFETSHCLPNKFLLFFNVIFRHLNQIKNKSLLVRDILIDEMNDFYFTLVKETDILSCYKCKISMYLFCEMIQIYKVKILEQKQLLINQITSFMAFYLKENELLIQMSMLSSMFLQICQDEPQLILLSFEYIKATEERCNIQYDLFSNNFTPIYLQLFKQGRTEDIYWLVDKIINFPVTRSLNVHVEPFSKLFHLIICNIINNKDEDYFFEMHLQIVNKWKYSRNPYLAIYFAVILKARRKPLIGSFLHQFIAKSLNLLGSSSRKIILNIFYKEMMENYSPMKSRRSAHLMKNHIKYQIKKLPPHQFLNVKINSSVYNKRRIHDNRKKKGLELMAMRQYKNLIQIL